jgi:proteasome lid subunit RPN8/RPN11
MSAPPAYPDDVLAAALAHAGDAAPFEACGLVVRHRDGLLRYRPVENAADRYRAADPAAWPWGAGESFVLAPGELVEILRAVDRGDAATVAVVHSHPAGTAALSARDRAGALDPGGRPVLPVDEWLVIGLGSPGGPEVRGHRYGPGGWSSRGLPLPPAAARRTVWRWGRKLCPCRNAGR